MKRFMKSIICVICITAIMTVSAYADEAPPQKTMTIDQAIDYASKNHPGILAAKSVAQANYVAIDEARANKLRANRASYPVSFYNASTTVEQTMLKSGIYVQIAMSTYDISQIALEQTTEAIKLNVKGSFYNYLTAEERVKLYKSAWDLAVERYNTGLLSYQQGLISAIDLEAMEMSIIAAENEYHSAVRNAEIAKMNLNGAIGLPYDSDIVITGKMEYTPMPEILPEEAVKIAETESNDIKKAKAQLNMQKLNFDGVSGFYSANTYAYKQAKGNYDAAVSSTTTAIDNSRINIYKSYDTMVSAYKGYELARKNEALNGRKYNIAKIQFEMGMISPSELESIANEYTESRIALADATYGILMTSAQYEFSYTVGTLTAK